MQKILTVLPVILGLSACGGGGGGDVATTQLISTFGDDAGVVRVKSEDGVYHVMTPEAREVAGTGTLPLEPVAEEGTRPEPALTNDYGKFYAEQVTVNGTTLNAISYEDDEVPVGAALIFDSAGNSILLAGGDKPANLPSGTYIYRGTNIAGARDLSFLEDGTFEMAVDFTSGTASIQGTTDGSGTGGVGTFVTGTGIDVDTRDGTFTGNNLRVGRQGSAGAAATIDGSFHGDGATGVTGLYHDNKSTPEIAGVVVGRR